MGGARLLCLDCLNKEEDSFDTLDLCCAPESQCIEARVTYRQNLDGPHEPYHRLVKLRSDVLTHHFGRTYNLACVAFERVEAFCVRIAGACHQPQDEKETEKDAQAASASEPTTAEVSSESVKQDDIPATADDTKGQPEAESTEMLAPGDKSDDVPSAADGTRDVTGAEPTATEETSKDDKADDVPSTADGTRDVTGAEPTATEEPSKDDKVDDVPTAVDGPKDETKTEEKDGNEVSQDDGASQAQPQNEDLPSLPSCGNCNGSLSFPFWYCIFCSGQSIPVEESGCLSNNFADYPLSRYRALCYGIR
jgi:cytoskeletal protein RodZ